jgi:hypothetical protein
MGASKPRKQQLTVLQKPLADRIFAVIRCTWFRDGKEYEVEEMQLEKNVEHVEFVLHELIERCLRAGADVLVMSPFPAEEIGIVP